MKFRLSLFGIANGHGRVYQVDIGSLGVLDRSVEGHMTTISDNSTEKGVVWTFSQMRWMTRMRWNKRWIIIRNFRIRRRKRRII